MIENPEVIGIFYLYIVAMDQKSDIVIIGGGLAGLTASIHLAKFGFSVTLIEKDTYPKHKVCGEYISNEVKPYLQYLDIDIGQLNPVAIDTLHISTQSGQLLQSSLKLGGFGISRYTLDQYLYTVAKERGVHIVYDTVVDTTFKSNHHSVLTGNGDVWKCDILIGAHGKRSILDKKLNRNFIAQKSPWLGVKMHYKGNFTSNVVGLHNFEGGYCGISKVEDHKINVCYLVKYKSFKAYKDIELFQQEVLYKNQHLKQFFDNASPLMESPVTISQISFEKKQPIEDHVFMIGDAAGLIHPLCGNGMAMAMDSARLLCSLLIQYKDDLVNHRGVIAKEYSKLWHAHFNTRLKYGRLLQNVLLNRYSQQLAYSAAKVFPFIVPKIIKQTHGNPMIC